MRDYVVRLINPSASKPFAVAVVYASSKREAIELLNREHPSWQVERIS